jgi:hypothetical protein
MKKRKAISRRKFLEYTGSVAVASMLGPKLLASEVKRTGTIVRAAIHPAIGVARIGNSAEGYFIGPEVTEPLLTDAGQSRDASGALKRQAARFRVYGYDAQGNVVRELTADDAEIRWSAHLANKKAQWSRFIAPMDLPEAKDVRAPRRNPGVTDRARLAIDPGARAISGRSRSGAPYRFDGGKFMDTPVSLGELRTDAKGRLVVLGGTGISGSPEKTTVFDPKDEDTFNNADGWYDDISDGPVEAKVTLDGREIPVDSAWVIVAPPNYAPDVVGWRTLHDLLVDTFVEAGMLPAPATTSFTRDILPIFRRLTGLQWVNQGFATAFGKGTASDFEDSAVVARLADPLQNGLHQRLFDFFRHGAKDNASAKDRRLWPMIYGDAFGSFADSRSENLPLGGVRELHLKRWVAGDYVNDWNPDAKPARRFAQVPLEEQPAMLDQAALHFCLADAFHPGCELTWPMRHASLYRQPFRIRQRGPQESERDYGPELGAGQALQAEGPLFAQGPGDLTRWMAIPWQGDTVFCRSGYDPEFDPYLPTFWAARVPNQVLTESAYATVMDPTLPRADRVAAFKKRESWVRAMKGRAPQQILDMVTRFGQMGVVEARPGIPNDPDFPAVIFVESLPAEPAGSFGAPPPVVMTESVPKSALPPARSRPPKTPREKRVEAAGWESPEQLEEFSRIFKKKPRKKAE